MLDANPEAKTQYLIYYTRKAFLNYFLLLSSSTNQVLDAIKFKGLKKIKGLERGRNLVWRYPIKFGYMCVYPYTESFVK